MADHAGLTNQPTNDDRIMTRCPSCGASSLFVGSGGHLTCSVIGCKEPGVGSAIANMRQENCRLRTIVNDLVNAAGAFITDPYTYVGEGVSIPIVMRVKAGKIQRLAAAVDRAKKEMGTCQKSGATESKEVRAAITRIATTKAPQVATESASLATIQKPSESGDATACTGDIVKPTEADREMAMEWWQTPTAPPGDEIGDLASLIARVRGAERDRMVGVVSGLLRAFDFSAQHNASIREAVRAIREAR